jgi:formate/nitrite transporter
MLLLPLAVMRDRITVGMTLRNFALVLIGNLIGSLFVAYFLAVETGVVTQELQLERLAGIAELKGDSESNWQIFLRALGCNWLVCLAVWMALGAESIGSKVLAIFFPILAFVAMGFDHVVANMFFLPAAIFADVPGIGWDDALSNWLFALLGNLVGAAVFVAGAYYFLYGRDEGPMRGPGDMPAATGTSGGAGGGDGAARQRELVGR